MQPRLYCNRSHLRNCVRLMQIESNISAGTVASIKNECRRSRAQSVRASRAGGAPANYGQNVVAALDAGGMSVSPSGPDRHLHQVGSAICFSTPALGDINARRDLLPALAGTVARSGSPNLRPSQGAPYWRTDGVKREQSRTPRLCRHFRGGIEAIGLDRWPQCADRATLDKCRYQARECVRDGAGRVVA